MCAVLYQLNNRTCDNNCNTCYKEDLINLTTDYMCRGRTCVSYA